VQDFGLHTLFLFQGAGRTGNNPPNVLLGRVKNYCTRETEVAVNSYQHGSLIQGVD